VLCPRETHCFVNKKKILFPSSFWGIFDFFVFFNNFGNLEKNKRMLRYKGGTSVADILVSNTRKTLMLRARGNMQEKDTREKSSMVHGVNT
jgi:hypothetical protein